jgi:hypothetical protein
MLGQNRNVVVADKIEMSHQFGCSFKTPTFLIKAFETFQVVLII